MTLVAGADHLFLFLDYDGTIVPLRKTPGRAVLSLHVRRLLSNLRDSRGTTVGVITGRSLADIERLLNMEMVVLAASHGFEIQTRRKKWIHPVARTLSNEVDQLSKALHQNLEQIPRVLIENKRGTVTVHYRNVAASKVERIGRIVRDIVRPYKATFKITGGKKILEIRPDVSWGKGHAILRILQQSKRAGKRLVVYCGDDLTDEDAFRVLPRECITIRVGKDPVSKARFSVRNVTEVHRFLRVLEAQRRSSTPT